MARKPKRDLTVEEQLARGPLDLPFLMLVLLLLGIGLIMMFSASYATAYYTDGDPLVYISRQALFGAVGVVGMFVVSKINYQTFRWMSMPALIGSIVLLVLVFTPLGGPAVAEAGDRVPALGVCQDCGHPLFCRPAEQAGHGEAQAL